MGEAVPRWIDQPWTGGRCGQRRRRGLSQDVLEHRLIGEIFGRAVIGLAGKLLHADPGHRQRRGDDDDHR